MQPSDTDKKIAAKKSTQMGQPLTVVDVLDDEAAAKGNSVDICSMLNDPKVKKTYAEIGQQPGASGLDEHGNIVTVE